MGIGGFFGALLILGGVLISLLCGLCTLAVIGTSVSSPSDPQGYGGGGMIGVALLLGGVPTVFGLLMIWAGIVLIRNSRKSAAPTPPPVNPDTFS
jgi:hypothetical protein